MPDPNVTLRKLVPQPSHRAPNPRSSASASSSSQTTLPLSRRRPAVSNACNNCKKRKTKCDGGRPSCSTCVERGLRCEFAYAQGVSPSQGAQQRSRNYRSVLELLRSGSRFETDEVLRRIRVAKDVDAAADSIAEARPLISAFSSMIGVIGSTDGPAGIHLAPGYHSHESRLLKSPLDDHEFVFERQFVSKQDEFGEFGVFVDLPVRELPLSRWTSVSDDDAYMSHLIHLAFTWDNAVEHTFYQPIFEEDVAALNPDSADDYPGSFCSRFLVNALLALSCIYSRDPSTFKIADDDKSRGRWWADEAERLLQHVASPCIAVLQGIYALFIYEGNLGEGIKSVQHFTRAMEVYKALNEIDVPHRPTTTDESRLERERQARGWCLWGFYCLEWRSSEAFGFRKQASKPRFEKVWREPAFPLRRPDCIGYWWSPYPMSLQQQPWMQVEIREADVTLSELAEQALAFLHPQSDQIDPLSNPGRALQLYDALIDWENSLPNCLRLEVAVLPSAILLHVYVEVLIMAILRPFTSVTRNVLFTFSPRYRCARHAKNLIFAIWTFRAYGQIRCEYYLTHPLSSTSYILLLGCEEEPVQMDTLVRACQCLHEMKPMLPLATDVMSGIRAAFKRYRVRVPEYMSRYFHMLHHRADGLMHHAVAGLLPSSTGDDTSDARVEIQLQELLEEFDKFDVD